MRTPALFPQAMPARLDQDPRTSETKRFHPDEKSWHQDPRVFVDSGDLFQGTY